LKQILDLETAILYDQKKGQAVGTMNVMHILKNTNRP